MKSECGRLTAVGEPGKPLSELLDKLIIGLQKRHPEVVDIESLSNFMFEHGADDYFKDTDYLSSYLNDSVFRIGTLVLDPYDHNPQTAIYEVRIIEPSSGFKFSFWISPEDGMNIIETSIKYHRK